MLIRALVWTALSTTLAFGQLSNASLNGNYYFRHILLGAVNHTDLNVLRFITLLVAADQRQTRRRYNRRLSKLPNHPHTPNTLAGKTPAGTTVRAGFQT